MRFRNFITEHFGTYRKLAEALGIHYTTASIWMRKPSGMTIEHVKVMSEKSGVSMCEIVSYIQEDEQ